MINFPRHICISLHKSKFHLLINEFTKGEGSGGGGGGLFCAFFQNARPETSTGEKINRANREERNWREVIKVRRRKRDKGIISLKDNR